jgi:hypothetical protein
MTPKRKQQLSKFLIEYAYKLQYDTGGKTITDVMNDLKSILINLKKLRDKE